MIILGIESSCDETAAALVQDGTKIISSVVASSQEIHKKYGGIVPEQAAREQLKSITPVINEAFENSKLKTQNSKLQVKTQNLIDAIAITVGPGLIGSLLVGVETAKTLAWLWNKPVIPVNHLIAHIYANFINPQLTTHNLQPVFPVLGLIVSGGHSELFLIKNHGQYKWIGGTRDDAAGECFDKCARLLGLGYPGGPAIAAAADLFKRSDPASLQGPTLNKIKLPRPMLDQDNFDFSFSGLKTAVLNLVKTKKQTTNQLAFEIQEAICDVLVAKTLKAAQKYQVNSILIGGGVAANQRLRDKFYLKANSLKLVAKIFIPNKNLCTDNAACIAAAAYFNYRPVPWQKIKADSGLEVS
jgi:N6-L-threonylcarbamoyladenine synthase